MSKSEMYRNMTKSNGRMTSRMRSTRRAQVMCRLFGHRWLWMVKFWVCARDGCGETSYRPFTDGPA